MRIWLSVFPVVLWSCIGQVQATDLVIGGPDSIKSDREKPAVFSIATEPQTAPDRLGEVQVTASAGTVLPVEPGEKSTRRFGFRPPWVATGMRVRLEASARLGKRVLRAHKFIRVRPPTGEPREIRSGGPLDIRAPARLVFDRQESATITLGKPSRGIPRLLASTGGLSDPEERPDGRLQSTYTPPPEPFPRVAIIAAVQDEAVLDWIAVPLLAPARVDTRTEPGARVDIRIGDTLFGPLRADPRGQANMDVLVPPGVSTGTTIATDRLGNTKKTRLDLRVPAYRRIVGVCPEEGDRLELIAVDHRGQPLGDAAWKLNTTRGSLSPPEMTRPGVYRSILSLPAGVPIGETVRLAAALRGDPASRISCSLQVAGRLPADMKLVVSPPVFRAGGSPLAVSIELLDQDGRPARMVTVELEASLGRVSDARGISPGKYAARWSLPDRWPGQRRARLRARTRATPVVSAETAVNLEPGPVARIELEAEDSGLAADGQSSTTLSARAVDRHGNPVFPVKLRARGRGRIGKLSGPNANGTYRATYTAPELTQPGPDTVVVTEERTRIEASLRIDLEESRPALCVGPRIGYSTNLGRISSAFFAADAAIRLPFFSDLSAGVELGAYWSDTRSLSAGGEEPVSTSVWVVPILARLTYSLPVGALVPYLGIGAGTAIVGREVSSESSGRLRSTKAHLGLSGNLGAGLPLGPGQLVVELAYLYILSDETVVRGNPGGLLATAGYRFGF